MSESRNLQFVDTNVLIYAHDRSAGDKYTRARDLVRELWQSGEGCLSIQVLQEFFVNVTQKVARPLTPACPYAILDPGDDHRTIHTELDTRVLRTLNQPELVQRRTQLCSLCCSTLHLGTLPPAISPCLAQGRIMMRRCLPVGIFFVLGCLWWAATWTATAAQGSRVEAVLLALSWQTETVDSAVNGGLHTSLEIDEDGRPHISYQDTANNALKYANESKRLTVNLTPTDNNGVELSVRDYGPGIPDSEIRSLFEPFYRGSGHSASTTPGTGLGLALVKRHVEAMGGRVSVTSQRGMGSTFSLLFPADREIVAAVSSEQEAT